MTRDTSDADLYADARQENACYQAGHPTTTKGRCWCGTVRDAMHRPPPPPPGDAA